MACGRPKCVEARRRAAALKAGRGTGPAPSDTSQNQQAQPSPSPSTEQALSGGVSVSTNNKKGIVQ